MEAEAQQIPGIPACWRAQGPARGCAGPSLARDSADIILGTM